MVGHEKTRWFPAETEVEWLLVRGWMKESFFKNFLQLPVPTLKTEGQGAGAARRRFGFVEK